MIFYDLSQINLGEASQTGHTVYKKAIYTEQDGSVKKIIYKKNKNNKAKFSLFEATFSNLANRFLSANLTPEQVLVKNEEQEIVGLASEHFCYAAAKKEGLATFYSIEMDEASWGEETSFRLDPRDTNRPEDIPVYFFDQFNSGFFTALWNLQKRREIVFDMSSLASVLTSSYSLEEDDLHKGNLGFYIVNRNNHQVVVFFKIDNDLLLADSVMSRHDARFLSWTLDHHAFDITARDLKTFPMLLDSGNHYWPSSKRFFINPLDNRAYSNSEINIFIELGKSKAFRLAKWREFYKHILIPPALIEESLIQTSDLNDPDDRAQAALFMNAVVARQAKLRAVLFSIPEFRSFVRKFNRSAEAVESLQQEILRGCPDGIEEDLTQTLEEEMQYHDNLCNMGQNGFARGDTPLHVAIKLGDYRYHETWEAFSQFAEVENRYGEKPLDLAISIAKQSQANSYEDLRRDPFFIIKSLLDNQVSETNSYRTLSNKDKNFIKKYQFDSEYLHRAEEIADIDSFLQLMQDLGEDYRLSLKMKKEISVACMKQFIRYQRSNPDYAALLTVIKLALNGDADNEPAPELQFIRQLRSRLWIVRKIRGIMGGTATQTELNELIDEVLVPYKPAVSCWHSFCFFSSHTDIEEPVQLQEPNYPRKEERILFRSPSR